MQWRTQDYSRVVAGNSAFLLSCNGYLGELLCCVKGVNLFSSFERGPGIAPEMLQKKKASWGNLVVFLELLLEAWGYSLIVVISGSLLGCSQWSEVSLSCEEIWDGSQVNAGGMGSISHLWGNLMVFL